MDNPNQKPSLVEVGNLYKQNIPIFKVQLYNGICNKLIKLGYKRVRSVVCFPTESDQLILCQGLLNPTVYSIAGRVNHTPDVQSSWFFRPIPSTSASESILTPLSPSPSGGGIPQYRDGWTLYAGGRDNTSTLLYPTRSDEIQGVPKEFSNIRVSSMFDSNYNPVNMLPTINVNV
jgi:hypothetical protein